MPPPLSITFDLDTPLLLIERTFPRKHLRTPSTAPRSDAERRTFRITHPFHPLSGKELELVTYRHNWGEDRVYFYSEQSQLISIPARWTDVLAPDPFVSVAAGRALFRTTELKKLVALVDEFDQSNVDQAPQSAVK